MFVRETPLMIIEDMKAKQVSEDQFLQEWRRRNEEIALRDKNRTNGFLAFKLDLNRDKNPFIYSAQRGDYQADLKMLAWYEGWDAAKMTSELPIHLRARPDTSDFCTYDADSSLDGYFEVAVYNKPETIEWRWTIAKSYNIRTAATTKHRKEIGLKGSGYRIAGRQIMHCGAIKILFDEEY